MSPHLNPRPCITASAALLISLCLAAQDAEAQLVQTTGSIEWLDAPPSTLFRGALVSDAKVRGFAEAQGLTLSNPLAVDMILPDDIGPGGANGYQNAVQGTIPQNTAVDSYMFHFDKQSNSCAAACRMVFQEKILGIDFRRKSLEAGGIDVVYGGDSLLGNPNTLYPGHPNDPNGAPHRDRGMERTSAQLDEHGNLLRDRVHWIDDYTVELQAAVTRWPDEIRVLTEAHGPGGPPDFEIVCLGDAGCPCGNDSAAADQVGCLNSTGQGARLRAYGTSLVSAGDLVVRLDHLPLDSFAIVYLGDTINANPNSLGDGLRCVSPGPNGAGPLRRLGTRFSGSSGSAVYDDVIGTQPPGLFQVGSSWGFQGFYRDTHWTACTGAGFNLSNSVKVNFR